MRQQNLQKGATYDKINLQKGATYETTKLAKRCNIRLSEMEV